MTVPPPRAARPRALLLHGLESGPQGRKARLLAEAGFEVVAPEMPCGRRAMMRDPVFAVAIGLAVSLPLLGGATLGAWGVALGLGLLPPGYTVLRATLLRRAVRASLRIQRAALRAQPFDLLMGSSYGGAIGLLLLQSGDWTGPSLLLCPAWRLVAKKSFDSPPPPLSALPAAVSARTLVVHGRTDETVPYADSEALVEGSAATLLSVEDGHRLDEAVQIGSLREWAARVGVLAGPSATG